MLRRDDSAMGLMFGVAGIFVVMIRNQFRWIKEGRV